jgi:TolB-like protein
MSDVLADLKVLAAGATPAAAAVPDGISSPYMPVERPSIWKRITGPLVRRQPIAPDVLTSSVGPSSGSPEPAPAAVDDFPIIPGPHKTLAVLPFRSLGNATDPAWSLSLLDTLIAQLSGFESLTIRPSSYVVKYLDQEIDPAEVGSELHADAVLLGSFLRSESTLRVTTQLIAVPSGSLVWAGKVDADTSNAIRSQDEICHELVASLTGKGRARGPRDLLNDENEEIRLDAVSTLKFSRDPGALEMLSDALDDPSPRVKAAAAEGLSRFGRAAAQHVTNALGTAIHDRNFETARYAAKTAGLIGGAELVPVLLEALESDASLLAAEAALALGAIRDDRARIELVEALARPDANVRFSATQALGQLGDARALDALEERMRRDPDEGVRAKALWAVCRIRRVSSGFLPVRETGVPAEPVDPRAEATT